MPLYMYIDFVIKQLYLVFRNSTINIIAFQETVQALQHEIIKLRSEGIHMYIKNKMNVPYGYIE